VLSIYSVWTFESIDDLVLEFIIKYYRKKGQLLSLVKNSKALFKMGCVPPKMDCPCPNCDEDRDPSESEKPK